MLGEAGVGANDRLLPALLKNLSEPVHKMDLRQLPIEVKKLIPHARLPASLIAVRQAMAACLRIDEVKNIADQATALATLAKEAGDPYYFEFATRVRDRAYQEIGERLEKYRSRSEPLMSLTPAQKEVAAAARLSPHKATNAVLIARMDPKIRDERIDGPNPPSVSKLAAEARAMFVKRDSQLEVSKSFEDIVRAPGGLLASVNFMKRHSTPAIYAATLTDLEAAWIRAELLTPMSEWLDEFDQHLRNAENDKTN